MPSTTRLRILGLGLLLATACKKEDNPAPASISQAQLEGRWQEAEGSYKHFDGKGKLTDSGYLAAANPAVYSTLDATTWKQSGQLQHEYIYVREDSTLIRSFYYNGGKDHLDETFRILQLTDSRLVLRQTRAYADGSKALDIQTYFR